MLIIFFSSNIYCTRELRHANKHLFSQNIQPKHLKGNLITIEASISISLLTYTLMFKFGDRADKLDIDLLVK